MSDNPQGYDHDEVRKPIWREEPQQEHKIYTNEDTYQTIKEIKIPLMNTVIYIYL